MAPFWTIPSPLRRFCLGIIGPGNLQTLISGSSLDRRNLGLRSCPLDYSSMIISELRTSRPKPLLRLAVHRYNRFRSGEVEMKFWKKFASKSVLVLLLAGCRSAYTGDKPPIVGDTSKVMGPFTSRAWQSLNRSFSPDSLTLLSD